MQRISMQAWNATVSYLGNLSGLGLAILGLGLASRVRVWVRSVALRTKFWDRTLTPAAESWARKHGMNGNRSPASAAAQTCATLGKVKNSQPKTLKALLLHNEKLVLAPIGAFQPVLVNPKQSQPSGLSCLLG